MPASARPEERRTLEQRLDDAEDSVKSISACQLLTDDCLHLLAHARAAWSAKQFGEARSLLMRVECCVLRSKHSDQAIRKWGLLVGLYEAILLVLLVISASQLWRLLIRPSGVQWAGSRSIIAFAVWGALGGAAAGLYGLYHHSRRHDFDSSYLPYYIAKPVLGLALGPLVYLLARAGLMAIVPGSAAAQAADHGGLRQPMSVTGLEALYLGAFVLGFGERFSLRLIDRFASALFGPAEAPPPSAPPLRPIEHPGDQGKAAGEAKGQHDDA